VDGSSTAPVDLDGGSVDVPFTLVSGEQIVPTFAG
jgi:hypothetical protein